MERKVVVTGLGAITPLGNTVKEFWDGATKGQSGIDILTKCNPSEKGFSVYVAGEVKNFDASDILDKKQIRRNDDFTLYGFAAATEAIKQAHLLDGDVPKDRVGVIVGSGIGGIHGFQINMESLSNSGTVSPFLIPRVITDIASGLISIEYGFMGPNFSVSSACATGNHAILTAYHTIQRGDADVMVTGGAEGTISILTIGGFAVAKALTNNQDPKTASRPWDVNRDGFVMGEGSGVLVLESEESAKRRGVPILAEIVGGGMSADAHHITAPHPEGLGAALAVNVALKNANIVKEDITYVNAHGTSTPLGDVAETRALKSIFQSHSKNLKVNSTKSMIGHLLGAAGGVEAVACIKTLQTGIIHPTINLQDPDPDCDLDYVANKAIEADVKYALSNSFGFGGHNCSLIFKRYQD